MDFTEHRLSYLTRRMHEFNAHVAPGSECNAWQDYVEHVHGYFGVMPWDGPDLIVDDDTLWGYWMSVANGVSGEYDARGGRL
jgi:hypothetical protein